MTKETSKVEEIEQEIREKMAARQSKKNKKPANRTNGSELSYNLQ